MMNLLRALKRQYRDKLFNYKHKLNWHLYNNRVLKKSINGDFVISLTSYPARAKFLELTLQRLLLQDFPERVPIVVSVWKDDLPSFEAIKSSFSRYGVEFVTTEIDYRSYKKYWASQISPYLDSVIIIADDDICYVDGWLRKLISLHAQSPDAVHGVRGNLIPSDPTSSIDYMNWVPVTGTESGRKVFLTGAGGMIFPRRVLYDIFNEEEKFMRLAPSADDIYIWFYLNSRKIETKCSSISEVVPWPNSQSSGTLWQFNSEGGGNNRAIVALLEQYPNAFEF
jgi:hypothetical protein